MFHSHFTPVIHTYERMRQWPATNIKAKGLVQWPSNIHDWRRVTLIFKFKTNPWLRNSSHCTGLKYFRPVTVTGQQSLYQISATVWFQHYIHDWSLVYSFIYWRVNKQLFSSWSSSLYFFIMHLSYRVFQNPYKSKPFIKTKVLKHLSNKLCNTFYMNNHNSSCN